MHGNEAVGREVLLAFSRYTVQQESSLYSPGILFSRRVVHISPGILFSIRVVYILQVYCLVVEKYIFSSYTVKQRVVYIFQVYCLVEEQFIFSRYTVQQESCIYSQGILFSIRVVYILQVYCLVESIFYSPGILFSRECLYSPGILFCREEVIFSRYTVLQLLQVLLQIFVFQYFVPRVCLSVFPISPSVGLDDYTLYNLFRSL